MKKLLALCLCLLPVWAWAAAPTAANSALTGYTGSQGSPISLSVTSTSGDGLIVWGYAPQGDGTYSVSGGGGTWVAGTSSPYCELSNYTCLWVFYTKTTTSSNPTISVSWSSSDNAQVVGWADISGASTSTFVDAQAGSGTTNGGYLSQAVTTTASTDLVVALAGQSFTSYAYTPGSGYTNIQSLTTSRDSAMATATPGTGSTNPTWTNPQGTSGGASYTIAILAAGGASCTHSGITSGGAIAVPNGWSGSYRGKTGGFVTPDCSTVNYLQTIGNFGVN